MRLKERHRGLFSGLQPLFSLCDCTIREIAEAMIDDWLCIFVPIFCVCFLCATLDNGVTFTHKAPLWSPQRTDQKSAIVLKYGTYWTHKQLLHREEIQPRNVNFMSGKRRNKHIELCSWQCQPFSTNLSEQQIFLSLLPDISHWRKIYGYFGFWHVQSTIIVFFNS